MGVMILIGVFLMTLRFMISKDSDIIRIRVEANKVQIVEFENLALIPGEQCEYTLLLESDTAEECYTLLDFYEIEEKTLKHYAYVKIESGDQVICNELLADVLENDAIRLDVNFDEEKNTTLKITYYLPVEVGNEAQNAEAIFGLKITASNE